MNAVNPLADTATLFLALADTTRLRLLNLLRDNEVCVSSFTEILKQSQPLISRHLAYLRSAGIVEARRDGKWMHYRLTTQPDGNTHRLLDELFKWMDLQETLNEERARYYLTLPESRRPVKREKRKPPSVRTIAPSPPPEPTEVIERYVPARHNELEDFLL